MSNSEFRPGGLWLKVLLSAFLAAGSVLGLGAQSLDWQTDLEAARQWAASSGRPLLLLADGGRREAPWDHFQKNVFTSDFPLDHLVRQLVPVRLTGKALDQFRIRGYPTVLLVRSDGTELARWEGRVKTSAVWTALADLLADPSLRPEALRPPVRLSAGQRRFVPLSDGWWEETDGPRRDLWTPAGQAGPLLLLRSQETGLLLALPPGGGQAFVQNNGLWLEAFWLTARPSDR